MTGPPPPQSSGTLVLADGTSRHLGREEATIEPLAHWRSPHGGAAYPSRWRLRVPVATIDVAIAPLLADQELRTGRSTGVTYWEGADTARGAGVNFTIKRLGSAGHVLQEERTIAENVGRGGARILTRFSSLAPGDIVHLEEVGGPFKTRAEVRGSYVGKGHVRRLNLRFLDSPAPDYLVHVDEGGTGGRRR